MCGRYSFTLPPEAIRQIFRVATGLNLQPRYNIAPTDQVPVIGLEPDGQRALKMFRWGLIPWWSKEKPKSAPLINARSEGIATSKMFGEAFAKRRCLVPADGFYEWNKDKSQKDKQPWRIVDPDRAAFAFAGVWEGWRDPAGEIVRSFAIVTTSANAKLAPIHDRMPVMLKDEDESTWLDSGATEPNLLSLLKPYERIELYRVGTRVNSVKNDDPACLKRLD